MRHSCVRCSPSRRRRLHSPESIRRRPAPSGWPASSRFRDKLRESAGSHAEVLALSSSSSATLAAIVARDAAAPAHSSALRALSRRPDPTRRGLVQIRRRSLGAGKPGLAEPHVAEPSLLLPPLRIPPAPARSSRNPARSTDGDVGWTAWFAETCCRVRPDLRARRCVLLQPLEVLLALARNVVRGDAASLRPRHAQAAFPSHRGASSRQVGKAAHGASGDRLAR